MSRSFSKFVDLTRLWPEISSHVPSSVDDVDRLSIGSIPSGSSRVTLTYNKCSEGTRAGGRTDGLSRGNGRTLMRDEGTSP